MKQLEIEWRHLDVDGKTCQRCGDTGAEVRGAVADIKDSLKKAGWEIVFRETRLNEARIAESNMILLNGIPIEGMLPKAKKSETCCDSCGKLLGEIIHCRVIERDGRAYETIPAALIREAVDHYITQHQ